METSKHSYKTGMSCEGKNSHTERRLLLLGPTVVRSVSLAALGQASQCGDRRPDRPGVGAHLSFHNLVLTLKSDVEKNKTLIFI